MPDVSPSGVVLGAASLCTLRALTPSSAFSPAKLYKLGVEGASVQADACSRNSGSSLLTSRNTRRR